VGGRSASSATDAGVARLWPETPGDPAFTQRPGSGFTVGAIRIGETSTLPSPILQPVVALVLWSLVMWVWLYATRIPAVAGKPMDPSMTKDDLNALIPVSVRWKADNYNHLMEQPTIFYATALVLAAAGQGGGLNVQLAWGYVGLRITHSLVQATTNIILVRFSLFMIASLVLTALAIRAALGVF
jgi:hypothetical protein